MPLAPGRDHLLHVALPGVAPLSALRADDVSYFIEKIGLGNLIAPGFGYPIRVVFRLGRDPMIKKMFLVAVLTTFAIGSAVAQESCESKAVGKDGKPLAGAAKTSFMKKCMADTCATKAVSSDGKPLSGAAKTSFMKKCEKGA
jgi:hypothetical protein